MATAKSSDNETKSDPRGAAGSPAAEGKDPTPPSGQGGKNPKSRPDHQDIWPPNPEPSDSAKEKAKENEELDKELHG